MDVSVDTITGQDQLTLRSFSVSESQNQNILHWKGPRGIESDL